MNSANVLSSKLGRLIYIIGLYLVALTISWLNLSRIHPDDSVPFFETAAVSLVIGFTALPLSAAHLVLHIGDVNIIQVGGRPELILLELVVSLVVFSAMLIFIFKGKKWAGLLATIYMLIAAPYWAYYSWALMGI